MQKRALSRLGGGGVVLLCALFVMFGCSFGPSQKAAKHRARAEELLKAAKYAEASIEYQAALQSMPGDAEALFGLARTFDALGEPGEYRKTLEKLLKGRPNHPGACVGLGGFFWSMGNYRVALELADRALKGEPTSVEARKLRARALAGLSRKAEAHAMWDQILAAGTDDDAAYVEAAEFEDWAGDKARAFEVLRRGLERFPKSSRLHLASARLLTRTGDLKTAGLEVENALRLNPEDPSLHAARADVLIREGLVADGLKALDAAQARFSQDRDKSARMAVARAQIHVQVGDLLAARRVLEAERKKTPEQPEVAAALANVLINLGEPREALGVLSAARRLDSSARTARLIAARAYLEGGRPDRALNIAAGLVAKGDLGIETHILYAAALTQCNRLAKARQEYLMLLIRDPGNHLARVDYARLLIALGEFLDASEEVAKLPPRIKDSSRAQFLQVQIDLGRGAREAAADRTKDLLARFPGNPFLMLLAADVERVSGHPDRALEYCRRARSIIPQDLAPVLAEVNLLRQIGKGLSDGVAVLAAYKNKFGETPLLLNCEALIFLENGRTLQALKTAERSTLVDPNYGPTRYLVARVLSASKESEAKVVGALEEAIKLDPSQPEPYNMLADLYLKKGDADRAEATYQRLLDLRPDDPVIANNLASLYLDRGRVKEALTLAWTAYVGASKNAYVLDTLGWALHLSGRPKEAQRFLAEAVSRLPENPPVLLHWGLNLRVRAKASESDDVLKRLLKVAPQSPEAARAAQALKG